MDTSFVNPFTSSQMNDISFKTSFNPNYKPRNQSNNNSSVAPIDRSKLCSISDIHPFFNSFVVRVRIATKSAIRTYVGRDGKDGKVFSFEATDESSEIRFTAFNNECDKYYDFIEKDLIYFISKGNVKTANKRFCNLKSDYEIILNSDSVIEVCDESIPLPSIQFKFVPIAQLVTQDKGTSVDVIGVITSVEEVQEIVSKKDNKEYRKRDVSLVDKTLHEVRLTLWSESAVDFNGKIGQVLAVKNAVVGDFRGKTLGCVQSSIIELDADIPEAHIIKGWYDKETKAGPLKNIVALSKGLEERQSSQLKYFSQITFESIPEGSTLYYNCKALIMSTPRWDKCLYKACLKTECRKKVREDNGFYYCDKCGTNCSQFEWRLVLFVNCADATADVWVTAFQEVAEKLIGKNMGELIEIFESDPNHFQALISQIFFRPFILRIGSKVEDYNNEKRIKSTLFGFTPVDVIENSKKLIQTIKCWPK